MVLGLSGGLTFVHLSFVKIAGFPLTSYRMPPGAIYRGLGRAIGVRWQTERYARPELGAQGLDQHLAAQRIVGAQTCVYWLPYFPPAMRFHFNGHNLIVYGKDQDDYLISDPVFEETKRCPSADLTRARFTKGALAPKGLLYFPREVPPTIDYAAVIPAAIQRTVNAMTRPPIWFLGLRGMRTLARRIERMPEKIGPAATKLQLGHIVRMQEEIGTGGGGFRFMYAAFLQEAGERLNRDDLREASRLMTQAGDHWRQFALSCARYVKDKDAGDTQAAVAALRQAAQQEASVYRFLSPR